MYVCMYVCMYVYVCIYIYIYMYTHICIYIYIYTYVHMCICIVCCLYVFTFVHWRLRGLSQNRSCLSALNKGYHLILPLLSLYGASARVPTSSRAKAIILFLGDLFASQPCCSTVDHSPCLFATRNSYSWIPYCADPCSRLAPTVGSLAKSRRTGR